MTNISLKNVDIEFRIYDAAKRSVASSLLGRHVGSDLRRERGQVIVSALKDINLTVGEGERLALIGPNGAGKSTLLQVIGGIYEPVRGEVQVQGTVSPLFNAMLGLNADESGYENLLNRATLFGIPSDQVRAKWPELIELTGLGDYLSLPVRSYSSGMRARLAFVLTLLLRADILLLDEWIGFVDHEFSLIVEAQMNRLAERAGIMVLASHNENLIERICTRGVLLRRGEIEFDGDPLEALRRYYRSVGLL